MTLLLEDVVRGAAQLCVAAGFVAGALAFARCRSGRMAVSVALDFWLAAGLLTLSLATTWTAILAAAAIVGLRRMLTHALAQGTHQAAGDRPG
ncbi:DUF1622 domain-containing protein [Catellatospora chokoriensis]|uniref:DUF1622 domain-containing protein n=1 Tax=Catellatospora chokoriensis TaxID=310353 RepID=A0A8J3NR99_9ACTN|nr:DUF1622 domain-containing protein [Catellatospora chokoriensis]GIF89982.1 hypothetical protein Cch02nite_34260 [Catellatospora chokoriensis]